MNKIYFPSCSGSRLLHIISSFQCQLKHIAMIVKSVVLISIRSQSPDLKPSEKITLTGNSKFSQVTDISRTVGQI